MQNQLLVLACGVAVSVLVIVSDPGMVTGETLREVDCESELLNESAQGCVTIEGCIEEASAVDELCTGYVEQYYEPNYNGECEVDLTESFIRCDSDEDCELWPPNQRDYIHCEYNFA